MSTYHSEIDLWRDEINDSVGPLREVGRTVGVSVRPDGEFWISVRIRIDDVLVVADQAPCGIGQPFDHIGNLLDRNHAVLFDAMMPRTSVPVSTLVPRLFTVAPV